MILEDLLLKDQKLDTLLSVEKVDLSIAELSLKDRIFSIDRLLLKSPNIELSKKDGILNAQFLIDTINAIEIDTLNPWHVSLESVRIREGNFQYDNNDTPRKAKGLFDANHIDMDGVNLAVSQHSNDSVKIFSLLNFAFHDHSGLSLNYLMSSIEIDSTWVRLNKFRLNTPNSAISSPQLAFNYKHLKNKGAIEKLPFKLQFNKSTIGSSDIAYFVPKLKGKNIPLSLAGNLNGKLSAMRSDRLKLLLANNIMVEGNFSVSGLPNIDRTFIFAQFEQSRIDFKAIEELGFISRFSNNPEPKPLPTILTQTGVFSYTGNFTGFARDFVSYGNLTGPMGEISTDIAIRPNKKGEVSIDGRFITKDLNLGKFIKNKNLGKVSIHTDINGVYSKNGQYSAEIKGIIDEIDFKGQTIHEIFANGQIKNKSFNGELYVNDPNLDLYFNGKADMDSITPVFNFSAGIDYLNLKAFGYDEQFETSEIAGLIDANFVGSHLDSVIGNISINHFEFIRDNRNLTVDSLKLTTFNQQGNRSIQLESSILDLDLRGTFAFKWLVPSLKNVFLHYLPSATNIKSIPLTEENQFQLKTEVKNGQELLEFFAPNITLENSFDLNINFDSKDNTIDILTDPISLQYNQLRFENFKINSFSNGTEWNNNVEVGTLHISKTLELENVGLFGKAQNDQLETFLSWNNNDTVSYSGSIGVDYSFFPATQDSSRRVSIEVPKSNIWITDSLWTIEANQIKLDSTRIHILGFNLAHQEESIKMNGSISKNNSDSLVIDFNQLNLIHINEISKKDAKIQGVIDGDLILKDLYNDRIILSDLLVNDLAFRGQAIGNISLFSSWDRLTKSLMANVFLENDGTRRAEIYGAYTPSKKYLAFESIFNDLPLTALYPVLTSFANEASGFANGRLSLEGPITKPNLDGDIDITEGVIGIAYTKVPYNLNDRIVFRADSIIFPEIDIFDEEGNHGVFDGYITHSMFQKLKYNLAIKTDYLLGLKTTSEDSDLYYGTAHASGEVDITGQGRQVRMDLALRSENGTTVSIPLEETNEASKNDFIRFTSEIKEQQRLAKEESNKVIPVTPDSGFELYMDLEIVPNANVNIIFDEADGDIITGTGVGDLRIEYDTNKNLSMFGEISVEEGNYTFTFQNIINKKFKIERGGTISWNGDPYNALLDVNAIYSTRASLYDLFLDSDPSKDYSRRIKVDAIIQLDGELLSPAVTFAIDFPTADERTKEEVAQYLSTDDEINRQIISLLIIGQFYTPEYQRTESNNVGTNGDVVGNTTSELLSNQFSNWLSQISNDFDIGFNYRPGDDVSDREVEVALSTQFLNNRVTVNGNIGNNGSLQSSNSSDLIGEVEIYVKITENGKLQFKAYNRSNDDLVYDTAPYTQGIAFTYREEFNNWHSLFERYKQNRIKKRKERAAKKAKERLERSIKKSIQKKAQLINEKQE